MADEIAPGDPESTILVLHDPALDPLPFIRRLIRGAEQSSSRNAQGTSHPAALTANDGASPDTSGDAYTELGDRAPLAAGADDGLVPWTISNKYYTASVSFRLHALDKPLPDPHPVVVYVWSGTPPDPLPAGLTRLSVSDPPPDILLGVRLGHGRTREADEERFAELGVDVVDEAGTNDDDERPLDPLDVVRQTLMTHMWPTMERRPAGRHAAGPEARLGLAAPLLGGAGASAFPVTFSEARAPPRAVGPVSDFPTPEAAGYGAVPQEPPLEADVSGASDDDDDFGDFAAGAGAGARGPDDEEYARLDEWLDGDDEEMPVVRGDGADVGQGGVVSAGDDGREAQGQSIAGHRSSHVADSSEAVPDTNGHGDPSTTFEDDFGPPPDADSGSLPLDPTPILLHLQHVRAELADVADEDERRVRAGVEVARLMRSLGLGDDDLDLDDLDDLDAEIDAFDSRLDPAI